MINSTQFKIDWLEFTIEPNNIHTLSSILHFTLNFNVFLKESPSSKEVELYKGDENFCRALLIKIPRWDKIKLRFTGSNADVFYKRLKKLKAKEIKLLFPDPPKISRIDVKHSRVSKPSDTPSVKVFLEGCNNRLIKQSNRVSVSLGRLTRGFLLKIGSRRSPNHYRIYENVVSVEFELEIKKRGLSQFQKLFSEYNFLEFEERLTDYFCRYSTKHLLTKSCYMDWLAHYLRQKSGRVRTEDEKGFIVDYIRSKTLNTQSDKEYFYRLLQLLSFLHRAKKTSYELDSDLVYHKFEFKIVDFLSFIRMEKTEYKVKTTATFLNSLLTLDPVVTVNFSEKSYRRFVCFPDIKVEKVGNHLTARLVIVGDLYDHCYRFLLPEKFLVASSNYEVAVKLKLITSVTQLGLEKVFDCEAFLGEYKIPNRDKFRIKNLIIDSVLSLIESDKIEKKIKIITKKGSVVEAENLTIELLNKSRLIFFYEKIR